MYIDSYYITNLDQVRITIVLKKSTFWSKSCCFIWKN